MSLKKRLFYLLALVGLIIALVFVARTYRHGFFKKTATGLAYRIVRKGEGPRPQEGEILLLNMSYKTPKGKVLFSTEEQELPLAVPYTKDKIPEDGGFAEALSMLQKGDSMVFRMRAAQLFGENWTYVAKQHNLKQNSNLFLHLHLQDIMTAEKHKQWETEQIAMLQQKQQEAAAKQLQEDIKIIDNYLAEHKITAQKTSSGLCYVIDTPGQGTAPKKKDTVKVNYTGQLLDGKVFDTSVEAVAKQHSIHNPQRPYEPIVFQLGVGHVIPGWDEGIGLLQKGSKARLFIPSTLAYGAQGAGGIIPANAVLIFEVELVDIQK
ncbi:MAG: FKBP-type peptidyl-prolyl cis-trans isomerase [Bacteroidota bacterium]